MSGAVNSLPRLSSWLVYRQLPLLHTLQVQENMQWLNFFFTPPSPFLLPQITPPPLSLPNSIGHQARETCTVK